MAEIAKQTGTTVAVVRRLVGKVDRVAICRQQDTTARRIDAEPLRWCEKVAMWKEQTGQSEATFWRVLRRCDQPAERRE